MGGKQDWCTQGSHGQEEIGREFFRRNGCGEKFKMPVNKRKRGREGRVEEAGRNLSPLWNHSRAHSFICPRNSWPGPVGPQPGWPLSSSGQVVRTSIPGLHRRDPKSAGPGVRPGGLSLTRFRGPHLDFVKGIIPCHCKGCPSLADCCDHIGINRGRRCL